MGKTDRLVSLFLFLIFIFIITLSFFLLPRQYFRKPSSKEEIFSDFVSKELREKTLNLFKSYSFAEDISDFVVVGNFFEGSTEYGKIYLKNQEDLNKNPFLIFLAIKEKINKIGSDDYIVRSRMLALVDKLEIPAEKKMEFFGEQVIRKVKFDDDGYISDDSRNITESMSLFRRYSPDGLEILKYAKDSLDLNNGDKRAQDLLRSRLRIYFPKIAKDL